MNLLRCVVAYHDRPGKRADRFFCAALSRQFNHRHDVIFVAVYATGGEQTHDMNCFTGRHGSVHRAAKYWVVEEGTFFDFNVQTRQVLIHDTTCTQVYVANFELPI